MNRKKSNLGTHLTAAFGLVFILAAVAGWILNIAKLIESGIEPMTGMVIVRAIGIFVAPLGSVLGFM